MSSEDEIANGETLGKNVVINQKKKKKEKKNCGKNTHTVFFERFTLIAVSSEDETAIRAKR